MIEDLCAIIENRHNVWIVVFIVVIERVKEDSQACPHIRTAKNGAIVESFVTCVPKCQLFEILILPPTSQKLLAVSPILHLIYFIDFL